MRLLDDRTPQFDLTDNDVFLVPTFGEVGSRMSVDLTPPDGIGTTLPIIVANMTAVPALRCRRGRDPGSAAQCDRQRRPAR